MPPLHSQQLPRGVVLAHASTHPSRLCQESDEEMGNGEKGHLATFSEDGSQSVLPLPVHQPLVPPRPEIPSCSSPLPCTELEWSGDEQTESGSLGSPANGRKEEQLEISIVPRLEEIQLDRAHISEGKGALVLKRECPVLKLPDGFLGVDCIRVLEQRVNLSFQANVGVNPETTITAQVTARQQFTRLPKDRQQRGVIA